MSRNLAFARAIGVALFAVTGLSGCVAATVVGGAMATTGISVAQERSTRQALTDTEIRLTINNKFLNEDYGLFADLSTEVVEGRVLLTGSVPRQEQKIRAAELVWSTPDVTELVNEVVVQEDPGIMAYGSDLWITAQIRGAILADTHISGINYNIETDDGVVHVIGIARSAPELERVLKIASRIDGVKEVVSHVMTKYDERRTTPAAAG
ncbi:MAG: BON domain-containing protein [Pikeienuella sp.]